MDPQQHLIIMPHKTITKEEFMSYPPFSIAADGFVKDAPFFDSTGPRANFNHHENVERLHTRSTAAQLYVASKSGLFETAFKQQGKPHGFLYVNDCDQDVCLTSWLMFHYQMFRGERSSPMLTRLVSVSDLMDATSGMYRIGNEFTILEELKWIYEPYTIARAEGILGDADEHRMRGILCDTWKRIDDYLDGNGGMVPLDTEHEVIAKSKDWTMIREIGTDARYALAQQEQGLYAIIRGESPAGFAYVLGKLSPFSPIDLVGLYGKLNEVEQGEVWNGGDLVGGCLREKRSKLAPEDLAQLLRSWLG